MLWKWSWKRYPYYPNLPKKDTLSSDLLRSELPSEKGTLFWEFLDKHVNKYCKSGPPGDWPQFLLVQFLSEMWMAVYIYNVFHLIDLDQSVNKPREPHTPYYDINGILCGTTCISSKFQCVHWWVVEKCSTFNGSVYPYNVFYLINLDQLVSICRAPHTPHYDINGILCGATSISLNFQCVHWWVIENCSTFNGSVCGCMLISCINNDNYRM